MSLLESLNLFKFLEQRKFFRLEQPEKEALVDSLILAMACDGSLDSREREEVMKVARDLGWSGDYPVEDYVRRKSEAVLQAGPDIVQSECAAIAQRVATTEWLSEEIYYLAVRVVKADDAIVDSETHFLSTLTRELQLDKETQRLVIQRIRHESL